MATGVSSSAGVVEIGPGSASAAIGFPIVLGVLAVVAVVGMLLWSAVSKKKADREDVPGPGRLRIFRRTPPSTSGREPDIHSTGVLWTSGRCCVDTAGGRRADVHPEAAHRPRLGRL